MQGVLAVFYVSKRYLEPVLVMPRINKTKFTNDRIENVHKRMFEMLLNVFTLYLAW